MKKLVLFIVVSIGIIEGAFTQNITLNNPWILPNYANKQYSDDNLYQLRNAKLRQESFDYERALVSLDNAVAQDPNSADALVARAIFKRNVGMVNEAAADLRRANSLNPYAADLYGANGAFAILNVIVNEPESAIQDLTLSQKIGYYYNEMDNKTMNDKITIGESALLESVVQSIEEKDFMGALNLLDTVILYYPNSSISYDLRGMVFAHEGEYEKALESSLMSVALEPNFAIGWYNLGRIEKEMGQHERAEKHFAKAIDLQNNLTKARFDRALLLKSSGQPEAAIKEYDEIIEMRGGDYLEAYLNRGLAKKMTGDFMGALEDLNKVIKEDPTNPATYKNRGNLYLLYGYHRHAVLEYTEAIILDKDYAEAYFNRGLAQFLLYDKASGCQDLDTAYDLGFERALEKKKYFCVE